jgi:tetratricopeptide (TPR) repeat protein
MFFTPTAFAAPAPSAVGQLDDPVEPLAPKTIRTEEDEDRLTAAALFSAGRTLEQRDKQAEALRRYQRALRYAPDAKPILREMLPLAFSLERRDVALRYLASHLDDANINDPLLLRAAAEYLAESGDLAAAQKVYQTVAGLVAGEKPSRAQVLVQMELGRINFLAGKFADSAAAYKQVLDALTNPKKYELDAKTQKALAGDEGELFELMGSVFLEAKQPDEARRAFELLQKKKPDDARKLLNAARVELAAGKPQAALDELQKYFDAKQPAETITPFEVLAAALKDLDQSDKLISRLEALHKAQPDNAVLAFYLGEEYRKADRWNDAAKPLQAALDRQSTADAFQSLAQVYRQTGDAEGTLNLLGEVAAKSGSLSALGEEIKAIIKDQKLLAAVLARAKERHGEATADDAAVLQAAALLASEAKQWDDAETLMNLAVKANPKAAAGLLMAWGLDLLVAEKYDRSAAAFQRGIDEKALPEDNPAFYFYLAGALGMQEQTDEALAAAKRAAEKKSDDPMFASRPAWILYHGKRYDEAEKAYKEFIQKFDDDFATPGARDSVQQAKMVLSNLYVLRRDVPQAVEYLEQVLDEFPDDAGANNDLGYLWADENQHLKRALRMIQLAVADEPENAAYRDSLGWALFRLGRHAEALAELQKAIDLEAADGKEPDATVLDHLGDVHAKLGRTADAQAAWKQSIEAYSREKEAGKAKAVEQKLNASDKPPPSGTGR